MCSDPTFDLAQIQTIAHHLYLANSCNRKEKSMIARRVISMAAESISWYYVNEVGHISQMPYARQEQQRKLQQARR